MANLFVLWGGSGLVRQMKIPKFHQFQEHDAQEFIQCCISIASLPSFRFLNENNSRALQAHSSDLQKYATQL